MIVQNKCLVLSKKMKKYFTLFAISIFLPFNGQNNAIQTDRPDQTECPFIVPVGFFQMENGFVYEKDNNKTNQIAAPSSLLKFGISKNFELRLILEQTFDGSENKYSSEFSPILVGFKCKLFEEKRAVPLTSFIAHLSIPELKSSKFNLNLVAPEFRFTMQHTLNRKQTLSYNIGAEWNSESNYFTYIYTLATGRSISEKFSTYVEFYGFLSQFQKSDHRFDGGIIYLINPNHQLDISAGVGLSELSIDYFIGFGYSFKFKV